MPVLERGKQGAKKEEKKMSRRKGWQGCWAGCILGIFSHGGLQGGLQGAGYGPPGFWDPALGLLTGFFPGDDQRGAGPEDRGRLGRRTGLKAGLKAGAELEGSRVEQPAPKAPKDSKDSMHRVVAYLELPGTRERYVITAGAQVVRITGAGELSVVGVVTDPGDSPFLCLIRTATLVLGVWSDGRLVDTASGVLLGRVVAVDGPGTPPPCTPLEGEGARGGSGEKNGGQRRSPDPQPGGAAAG
jgi:hypothetical protein